MSKENIRIDMSLHVWFPGPHDTTCWHRVYMGPVFYLGSEIMTTYFHRKGTYKNAKKNTRKECNIRNSSCNAALVAPITSRHKSRLSLNVITVRGVYIYIKLYPYLSFRALERVLLWSLGIVRDEASLSGPYTVNIYIIQSSYYCISRFCRYVPDILHFLRKYRG